MTITKTLYIDMDGVLVDLQSNLDKQGWHQNVFKDPPPMAGAVEAFNELCSMKTTTSIFYRLLHGIYLILGHRNAYGLANT